MVDNWGGRFVEELDYNKEAGNSERFAAAMQTVSTMAKTLVVPKVSTHGCLSPTGEARATHPLS